MKRFLHPKYSPLAALGCGILTMLLRLILLGQADETGLLPAGHPASSFGWVVTIVFLVYLLFTTRPLNEATKYGFNFPASQLAAIGILAGAVGIGINSIAELFGDADTLQTVSALLGLLCVPSLLFLAHCRMNAQRPSVLFHALVCIYLMLHLVSHYRLWSSHPQLQTYGFELLALVCLMLSVYQRCAFDVGQGNRRAYVFTSLSAAFFSIAALPGSSNVLFYIGCAAWMLTGLCSLKPMPGRYVSKES